MQALNDLELFVKNFNKKTNKSFKDYLSCNNNALNAELLSFNTRLNTESPNDCNLPLTKKLMQERADYYHKLCMLVENGFNL
jgi:hypothetical protein